MPTVRQLQGIMRDPSTFGKKSTKLLRQVCGLTRPKTTCLILAQIRVMPGVLASLPGNVTKPILLNYLEVERLVRPSYHNMPEYATNTYSTTGLASLACSRSHMSCSCLRRMAWLASILSSYVGGVWWSCTTHLFPR